MALFDIPRRSNKNEDMSLIKKSNKVPSNKTVVTIKGGNGLLDRITSIKVNVARHLGNLENEHILIREESVLTQYIDKCLDNGIISIDTETTGLDPMLDNIAGICIYTPNEKGAYIPINHVNYITNEKIKNQLSIDFIRHQFERIKNIDVIMFNANFDIRVLRNQLGWKQAYCTWDCYLAMRLLNENEPTNALKKLHQKYVLKGQGEAFKFDELFKGIPFTMIPLKTAVLYAGHDAVITYELYDYQHKYLNDTTDRQDMRDVYWVFKNIEMPCVEVVCNMEDTGVLFDMDYQAVLHEKYTKMLDDKMQEIHIELNNYKELIDEYNKNCIEPLDDPVNILSTKQLAILLYDILKLDNGDDKKPRSTSEEILSNLDLPLAKLILEYRAINKLLSTYIDKLPNCINPNDNRIHCHFNQYGADTGRMSSSNPNLQNIPSHNKEIRKLFIASDGYVLMSSDYSQQEPKCLSALCKKQGDSQMYDTFMQDKDLYSEIASKSFNVAYEECLEHFPKGTPIKQKGKKWYYATLDDYDKLADGKNDVYADGKERRTQAKSILLGVLYCRGVPSIAEQLGCSVEKAQEIKDSVFKGFPAIKRFEQSSLDTAHEIGYVTTVCGRKRRLYDLMLDEYEFEYIGGQKQSDDLLDFDDNVITEVPERDVRRYLARLNRCRSQKERQNVIRNLQDDGIKVIDNGGKIANATRQCVNSRIQGSAADLTKLALIELNKNEELKKLGFRLLIPVHDEVIAECPEENMNECSRLLAETMSKAAEKILEMPIKCDVEITKEWYGEPIDGSELKERESYTSHAMDKELRELNGSE